MNRLKNVRHRREDALTRVGWDRLETMLADYYRGQGWSVNHVGTGGSRARFDRGVDLKLRKDGEYVLVQCKHWNAKQVTHNAVHELLGIKVNENATGAIVITSGEFTRAAREAATRQGHVQLIDGDALRAMLGPQLEAFAATEPPPLPYSPANRRSARGRRGSGKSLGERWALLIGALLAAVVIYFGVNHFLRAVGVFPLRIDVPLPSRVESNGRVTSTPRVPDEQPAATPMSKEPPKIEQGMTGAELEEWKRKNEESMRTLEASDSEER